MWKVVITEIQDGNAIDPASAPPGAFFVSSERFAKTVEHLDLPRIISLIDGMQVSQARPARSSLRGKIPAWKTSCFAELEHAT